MEPATELIKISQFLSSVKLINKEYEILSKHSGESFNIFNILGLQTNEVRLHSALLAELLNPKGSHQQGDRYLSLFLHSLGLKDLFADSSICTLHTEYFIGFINDDYTEGGRIDILIESPCGNCLLIENKIYAPNQRNQLLRYKNHFPKSKIVYLTLDGSDPGDDDLKNLVRSEYQTISYQSEMLEWLDQCMEKSVNLPIIRESIRQYINLIRNLTNQGQNKNEAMEILELLMSSQDTFTSGKMIEAAFKDLNREIVAAENEVLEAWRKAFDGIEIELFQFHEYIFFFKLSRESGYLHFDLFPRLNGNMAVANDTQAQIVRTLAMQYDESNPRITFFTNINYTAWILPKADFHYRPADYIRFKQLRDNRESWIALVLKEAAEFIVFIQSQMKTSFPDIFVPKNDLIQLRVETFLAAGVL